MRVQAVEGLTLVVDPEPAHGQGASASWAARSRGATNMAAPPPSGGRGQACKQIKQLFLLRGSLLLPEVVTLPPTSLKAAKQYLLKLTSQGVPYYAVVTRIDVKYWVEKKGVKEIWLWAYHGGKLDLWESNMAGPFGDVSNSDRDPTDLPTLRKTYTVSHYNYQRGLSEAIEDHMHQIEAVLNYVDGRDVTPEEQWSELLFWGKFVGSDKSHKIVRPGCGWAHYPPNAERDYDWKNPRLVWTDLEDWRPDGTGTKRQVNCERWNCNSLDWFMLWMQSLPGWGNGLEYQGRPLTNWWIFIGDFDAAMKRGLKLVQ